MRQWGGCEWDGRFEVWYPTHFAKFAKWMGHAAKNIPQGLKPDIRFGVLRHD
jgi:hypothetical protein